MKVIPNELFFAQVEDRIAEGKTVRFKVKGVSMMPFLRNGIDEVILAPLNGPLKIYDIVLFKYKGRHILHRIIDVKDGTYIIQGDGVYLTKEYCTAADVVGIVTHICRPSGKVISVSSSKFMFMIKLWLKLGNSRRYALAILRRL